MVTRIIELEKEKNKLINDNLKNKLLDKNKENFSIIKNIVDKDLNKYYKLKINNGDIVNKIKLKDIIPSILIQFTPLSIKNMIFLETNNIFTTHTILNNINYKLSYSINNNLNKEYFLYEDDNLILKWIDQSLDNNKIKRIINDLSIIFNLNSDNLFTELEIIELEYNTDYMKQQPKNIMNLFKLNSLKKYNLIIIKILSLNNI